VAYKHKPQKQHVLNPYLLTHCWAYFYPIYMLSKENLLGQAK